MRILIVSQYFWPENFRVNDLSAGLIERGHQVTVLTGMPNYPSGKFFSGYGFFKNTRQNYRGAEIIRVPIIPRGKGGKLCLILNYLSFVISGSLFVPFLLRKKYDIVFVYGISPVLMAIPAIIVKKIYKIPLILYVLDLWPETLSAVGAFNSTFVLNQVGRIVRFIYRNCDQILVSSPGFTERVKAIWPLAKIDYWPQWAEDSYRVLPAAKALDKERELPSGFRIMFAGNIGAAQGFKTMVEAADRLKNYQQIHWIILGDGRMRKWVEEEIRSRKLGNNFHLLGKHPVEEMPRYFALADVLLVTLKDNPIFSLTIPAKIQSYMACGRPVLACLNGEGAKIIEESGAGISCFAENPESLAQGALKMFSLSESERDTMGKNGRAYSERHFNRKVLLDEFENWMENLR